MTRSIIGGIVAIVIAALTATAYFVTSGRLESDARADAKARVGRAANVIKQQPEGLIVLKKAEALSTNAHLLNALHSKDDPANLLTESNSAWRDFKSENDPPDILALMDTFGGVLAEDGISHPSYDGELHPLFPAVAYLIKPPLKRVIISEIWNVPGKGLMRVGVAPIIDPTSASADATKNPDNIVGLVIVAYSLTAADARKQARLLGTDVAYFDKAQAYATSFQSGGKDEEDTGMQGQLSKELAASGLATQMCGPKQDECPPVMVEVGGKKYQAVSVPLATFPSKPLPADYPMAGTAGAVVLAAPAELGGGISVAKIFILVLGIGALGAAMLGLYMSNHRILFQVDQIEQGVTDIINGNLDRTFRPVGEELEGLSNGLNVMLARLLGRPEPGEEEFDDEGNPIVPGRVEFEEADENAPAPAPDPDLAALAQEPEPDYYKRVFTEYVEGRKSIGHPDEVSFENFIAKLRVNEGKLKGQYNCKAVRFRVVVKDGKVTLKPVPIFG